MGQTHSCRFAGFIQGQMQAATFFSCKLTLLLRKTSDSMQCCTASATLHVITFLAHFKSRCFPAQKHRLRLYENFVVLSGSTSGLSVWNHS